MILVPTRAAFGVPIDTFFIVAHSLKTDFGQKSALASDADSLHQAQIKIAVGTADTVNMEITNVVRSWRTFTASPRSVMLRQSPEGLTFGYIEFGRTTDLNARPALHISFFNPFFPHHFFF